MAVPGIPIVHSGRRFLSYPNGEPFFWLADTAWELFHRLTRAEADQYLRTRAKQGFNVIQAVLLAELDGLHTPNANGHHPLLDDDPTKPDPSGYWENVDWVVDRANELGIHMALLPTWGDKINKGWGTGPVIFDEGNAYIYGAWVGKRYGNKPNVMWINGGDRDPADRRGVYQALAKGIRDHEGKGRLMTFHAPGGSSSSDHFHNEDWLDFNSFQSGHWYYAQRSDEMLSKDYGLLPTKPSLDSEPNYENHRPFKDNFTFPYFRAFDVRRASYWSVFAGGCGITYGCHAVWQMASERYEPLNLPLGSWRQSLELPGAQQMKHLKSLMLSRRYFDRVPDQSLILEGLLKDDLTARATRGPGYAMVYIPGPRPLIVDTTTLGKVRGSWFNPRTGAFTDTEAAAGYYNPPTAEDWVLILDSVR